MTISIISNVLKKVKSDLKPSQVVPLDDDNSLLCYIITKSATVKNTKLKILCDEKMGGVTYLY